MVDWKSHLRGRSVWQRNDVGSWYSIGPAPLASDAVIVGFEDIDGFGEGWLGDVWCHKNGVWNRIVSPVSTNLHAVCCASDGFVYAVGSGGVMIKGRGESWAVLATGWDADLMDVAEHAGQIIVVTNFTILTLVGEALVRDQNFATDDVSVSRNGPRRRSLDWAERRLHANRRQLVSCSMVRGRSETRRKTR